MEKAQMNVLAGAESGGLAAAHAIHIAELPERGGDYERFAF
eukprot:gene24534-10142_t